MSGDTRQSLNISSRRCAHTGVIFSPPHLGLSIGHMGWKRVIQQEVTRSNGGQKRRDSKSMSVKCPLRHVPQDLLLSFGNQVRYKYARTASPISTPSSARLIGLWRVGDDL